MKVEAAAEAESKDFVEVHAAAEVAAHAEREAVNRGREMCRSRLRLRQSLKSLLSQSRG